MHEEGGKNTKAQKKGPWPRAVLAVRGPALGGSGGLDIAASEQRPAVRHGAPSRGLHTGREVDAARAELAPVGPVALVQRGGGAGDEPAELVEGERLADAAQQR